MTTKKQPSLSELQFVDEALNQVQVPCLSSDPVLINALYPEYQKAVSQYDEKSWAHKFDAQGRHANPTIVALINKIVSPHGIRVAVPSDSIYETFFPMIDEEYYLELNAFDIREGKPRKENKILRQRLIELAEETLTKGDFKLPVRVQGFYIEPDATEPGHRIKVVPAKNFRIIRDERLNLPTETRFNRLDDLGMIVQEDGGRFTWYGEVPLSRVCLGRGGGLGSYGDDLAFSYGDGRVGFVKTPEASR